MEKEKEQNVASNVESDATKLNNSAEAEQVGEDEFDPEIFRGIFKEFSQSFKSIKQFSQAETEKDLNESESQDGHFDDLKTENDAEKGEKQDFESENDELTEEELAEITDEEIEHFKNIYSKIYEETFINGDDEEVTNYDEVTLNDNQVRAFLASFKKTLNQISDPSNFTEEENIEREKQAKYMDSKHGEIMLSIGKPEDFPYDKLDDMERVDYLNKYLQLVEEYQRNLEQ